MIFGGHRPALTRKPAFRGALRALPLLSVAVAGLTQVDKSLAEQSLAEQSSAEPRTPAPVALAPVPLALSVRQDLAGHETRLIFALGACVTTESHVLENPARAIVDMPEVNFQIDPQVGRKPAGHRRHRVHAKVNDDFSV